MTDYIRKAVELAEGWLIRLDNETEREDWWDTEDDKLLGRVQHFDDYDQIAIDALAAQLVRQVDMPTQRRWVCVEDDQTIIYGAPDGTYVLEGDDRTLTTIKAIVDSGVLEDEKAPA